MVVSAALIAEQPQALPAKPERHISANRPLRHQAPAGFISQRQEPVIGLFFTVLSEEEPHAVPGSRGIALPAACLTAEPAITSYTRLGGTRADSTDFSFYREIKLKKSRTSGAAGRRAAGATRGEVATPLSPGRIPLSCTLQNIHVGLFTLLHKYFPEKGLFGKTLKAVLKESS